MKTKKSWEMAHLLDSDLKLLLQVLNDGWEPYAVVFIPGVGVMHYLRIYR